MAGLHPLKLDLPRCCKYLRFSVWFGFYTETARGKYKASSFMQRNQNVIFISIDFVTIFTQKLIESVELGTS